MRVITISAGAGTDIKKLQDMRRNIVVHISRPGLNLAYIGDSFE